MNKKLIWLVSLMLAISVILIFSVMSLLNKKVQTPYYPAIGVNKPKEIDDNLKNNLSDLIKLETPLPNEIIASPLKIKGQARGNWFFEASFPISMVDANGNEVILEPSYIMTNEDWMTTDFISFETTVTFSKPNTAEGKLILHKDNPSGLPEFDAEMIVPVKFE